MIGPGFAVVLGVAGLSLAVVAVGYVVWIRMVGLEPTLAQAFATLPTSVQGIAVVVLGVLLGVGAEIAPSVETGVAGAVMVAAAAFAGLIVFEMYGNNDRTARE